MTNALPRFDLSSMTLKTDDDLKALDKDAKSPFFKPGKHEVKIISSTYTGLASDDTWGKYQIEMEGAGGKTIRETMLVPYKDLAVYRAKDGKNTTYPAQKLTRFLAAIGETISVSSLAEVLPRLFSKDNTLAGTNVAIVCAFNGLHVTRNQDGIVIVTKAGDRLVGAPVFSEYADANKYAADNKLDLKGFVDVMSFEPSSVSNVKKAPAAW